MAKNAMKKFYNSQKIIDDLQKMGIKEEDSILVHSSFKSLYKNADGIEGGIESVIAAFKQTLCHGTLMLPALSYNTVGAENPYFDVNKTPSCVGAITEVFRTGEGVYRSLCATHSVSVWGKHAQEIAENHIKDNTPCGPNSPYAYLKNNSGKIVMLGCGLFCNTSMHGVEETVVPDYLFKGTVDYTIITAEGEKLKQNLKRHYFHKTSQRYDRIIEVLSPEFIVHGTVLDSDCYVIDASQMWAKASAKLKEDQHYFVDIG